VTINSKTLALDTALGIVEVTVSIEGTDIAADIIALSIFPLNPELPLGMSVNECKAVLIQIGETRKSFNLNYRAKLKSTISGTSCTGQFLAAMEWEDNKSILTIGTEDGEAICNRIFGLDTAKFDFEESYEPHFLDIKISELIPSQEMSFHIVIAENPLPEPKEASSWFAVDYSHSKIISYAKRM